MRTTASTSSLSPHGEARYFPQAGFAITRGWFRQADAIHNALFYTRYSTAEYDAGCRDGREVRLRAERAAGLTSNREPAMIAGSRDFVLVFEDAHWRIYRCSTRSR